MTRKKLVAYHLEYRRMVGAPPNIYFEKSFVAHTIACLDQRLYAMI